MKKEIVNPFTGKKETVKEHTKEKINAFRYKELPSISDSILNVGKAIEDIKKQFGEKKR